MLKTSPTQLPFLIELNGLGHMPYTLCEKPVSRAYLSTFTSTSCPAADLYQTVLNVFSGLGIQLPPPRAVNSSRGRPAFPFLVVIWMTPFDASVPYSVAAAGPFTTSIDSMSSGLMSLSRDGVKRGSPPGPVVLNCAGTPPACALFTRMPSM